MGLNKAAVLKSRSGYAELLGTWSPLDGPRTRAEVGVHPWRDFTAYAFGEAAASGGVSAGIGARYSFDW